MTTPRVSRGGRTRTRRSPRLSTAWLTSTLSNQLTNGGAQTFFDFLGALTVAEKRMVKGIVRILLTMTFAPNTAASNTRGRFGIIQVPDDVISESAGVPDPTGDTGAGWLINQYYQTNAPLTTDPPLVMQFDLRSRRRLDGQRNSLVFVMDVDGGGGPLRWSTGARVLYSIR